MSKNNILKLLVITALVILTAVIFVRRSEKAKEDPAVFDIITVRGADIMFFPLIVESSPLGVFAAGKWDVLFLGLNYSEVVIPFYHKRDGVNDYEFEGGENKVFCNGKLIFINLSGGEAADFIKNSDPRDLAHIQFIQLSEAVGRPEKEALQKINRVNKEAGLILSKSALLSDISGIFKPKRLIIDGKITEDIIPALTQNSNLEYLLINTENITDLSFLSKINNLKVLKTWDWDRDQKNYLPEMPKLESLYLSNISALKSFDEIETLNRVKQLTINEDMENFHKLSKFTDIESLIFETEGNLIKLHHLPDKKKLRHLLVTSIISQEEIDFIIQNFSSLEYLEVYNFNDEIDAGALKELQNLRVLLLFSKSENFENYKFLEEMKNLQLLMLNKQLFEDGNSEIIARLKSALPETIIVPVGICLGSGWLVPFCVAALAACFFIFLTKKKNAYDSGKRK